MSLERLEVRNVRCVDQATLLLDSRCNIIYGNNGSGKTSLLESIFLLSCGRSFRTKRLSPIIKNNKNEFLVVGWSQLAETELVMGVRGSHTGREAKLNGTSVSSFSELAIALPVQVIDPEVHKLLEEGPARRRRFLDWGTFHVEQSFPVAWKRYRRAIEQRNAALRAGLAEKMIRAWDQELFESGSIIANSRDRYIDSIKPFVRHFGKALLDIDIDLIHLKGWRTSVDLWIAMEEAKHKDRAKGTTTVGPHRADLAISISGASIKDRVSRGQQKLVACALLLAQQAHYAISGGKQACLLVDDPGAELDVDNLEKLLKAIAEIPTQLVITSLQAEAINTIVPARLFHVEQGHVSVVS